MSLLIDPDAEYTELAMYTLQLLIPNALDDSGPMVRARFDNAMLNIAVNRIVEVEGSSAAATILWRIADAIGAGQRPASGSPIELSQFDS